MKKLLPFDGSDTLSAAGAKLGLWMGAVLAPLYDILAAVMLLITIDFITGVVAAWRQKHGISSDKMINTVNKLLIYSVTLLAGHVVELKITPALPLLQLVSGFIALTELRSIFENFNTIFGLNIWEYVKTLIRQSPAGAELLKNLSKDVKKQKDE